MRRTWVGAALTALGAAVLLAVPAMAGGWATATITDVPDDPIAGAATTIGVELKQHGTTPISWETLSFVATESTTGATVSAQGRPEGPTGHYVIEVTFPREGQWQWRLQTMNLALEEPTYPTLSVGPGVASVPLAPAAGPAEAPVASPLAVVPVSGASGVDPVLVVGIALIAFLVGTVAGTSLRRPTRSATTGPTDIAQGRTAPATQ